MVVLLAVLTALVLSAPAVPSTDTHSHQSPRRHRVGNWARAHHAFSATHPVQGIHINNQDQTNRNHRSWVQRNTAPSHYSSMSRTARIIAGQQVPSDRVGKQWVLPRKYIGTSRNSQMNTRRSRRLNRGEPMDIPYLIMNCRYES